MKTPNGKKSGWSRCVMTCLLSTVVLVSLIAVSGCTKKEATPTPEIPSNYTTYTDEARLFSISYPLDWESALSLIPEAEMAVKDIITAVESDLPLENVRYIFLAGIPKEEGYLPNVNIAVESMPGIVLTHNIMVEAEINGIKQVITDYRMFSQVKTTVDGKEATIIDWEGTYPQLGISHCLQMFVLVGKTAWAVTCTPPLGEYSKWEEDFQAIVRSLRILK